jgi:hypothetical protein
VAAFDPEVLLTHPLDFRLVANGPVTMFWQQSILDETCTWLADHGYRLVYADADDWSDAKDMHRELAFLLGFPDYYGANLDALNDCLGDVAAYEYGDSPDSSGLVLVLAHFDAFVRAEPGTAEALLDIFAGQSRTAALLGHRMLCLIQSDDSRLQLPPVGATPVTWNDAEWLDARRQQP